jgi:hypothetical protein
MSMNDEPEQLLLPLGFLKKTTGAWKPRPSRQEVVAQRLAEMGLPATMAASWRSAEMYDGADDEEDPE